MAKTRMKNNPASELRVYVLGHIAEICREYADIEHDIIDGLTAPGRLTGGGPRMSESRRRYLQDLAVDKLKYIEKVIKDLRRLKML